MVHAFVYPWLFHASWSVLLAGTGTTTGPSVQPITTTTTPTLKELTSTFQGIYTELQQPAIYKEYSSTIKFAFVPPPPQTTTTTATAPVPNDDDDDTNVFQFVRSHYNNDLDDEDNDQDDHHDPTTTTSLKPIALYLPGLDCAGVSGYQQFHDLATSFELWRMTVTTNDTTSFSNLVQTVVTFIQDVSYLPPTTTMTTTTTTTTTPSSRNVILIGESFGGLLAPAVALELQKSKRHKEDDNHINHHHHHPNSPLEGLVLINPATSFESTNWDKLAPLLTSLQFLEQPGQEGGATPYTVVGGMVLATLIPDATQLKALMEIILGFPLPSIMNPATTTTPTSSTTTTTTTPPAESTSFSRSFSTNSIVELLETMDTSFGTLGKRLPPNLVRHRVSNWLTVGAQWLTETRLATLDVPTLVVAGEDDKFLPSKKEAERLTKVLPNCKTLLVKGAGHFVLDRRVNLTEAILYSNMDPLKFRTRAKKYDPITDWKRPNKEDLATSIDRLVKPLRRLTSPVFVSTDQFGKRWTGLGKLSTGKGPIVFVANHQLFGLDLGLIIAQLIEDREIFARGLAHPAVFPNETMIPNQPVSPGIVDKPTPNFPSDPSVFRKFGAVKVTPRNYFRLLQTGQNVLLFPGGVREVFHGKNEAYQLFWPETPDFVRTAVRFNATIVPISAVGAADSVNILVDAPDMAKLPFGIGKGITARSANVTAARFDQTSDDELFVPPLFVPNFPPARQYFVFGTPFRTTDVDHRDVTQCTTLYRNVKQELERGMTDVLRAREQDPFQDSVQRLAYEQLTGKTAPTFPIKEMNRKSP